MHRARRPLLLGVATLLLVVATVVTVSPSSEAATTQISIFKGVYTQTESTYGNPTPPEGNQPPDFTTPVDFSKGNAYYRLEILDKPSSKLAYAQLCFWRHTETVKFKYETCTRTAKSQFHFSDEGVYYVDAGRPVDFWQKNGVYDWSEPSSLTRIMLFDAASRKLLVGRRCGQACYPGNDLHRHIPIEFKAEVIFVAPGKQLKPPSDWSDCPKEWSQACRGSGTGATTTTSRTTTTRPTTTIAPTTTLPAGGGTFPGNPPYGATLSIDAGNRSFEATWPAVRKAARYQLRYRSPNKQGWVWDPVGTYRSVTKSGLANGTTYTVQVRAYADGSWRPWTSGTVTPGGSGGPTTGGAVTVEGRSSREPTVTVNPSTNSLAASWEAVPKAKLYQSRYRADDSRRWVWHSPTTSRNRTMTGLSANKRYRVEVRAYVDGSWRGWTTVRVSTNS